ncbi:MAG TPA: peptidylprolyl isomerase [Bryobacteraceae bacterium]|nr:peptidylprolyl isomerase [Bryobacteraceae bacterium]
MKGICPLIFLATAALAQKAAVPLKPGLYATFHTSKGDILAVLYEKYTPASVKNFVELAQGTKAWRDPHTGAMVKRPMYSNITFHRVLRGQMIQSGDPTGTSKHNCGVTVPDEPRIGLQFDRAGRLAVANSGTPNSGGCQFFITDDLIRNWNQQYTIFGQVVSGMDVVDAISHAPLDGDKPVDPVKLISVTISRVGPAPAVKRKIEK